MSQTESSGSDEPSRKELQQRLDAIEEQLAAEEAAEEAALASQAAEGSDEDPQEVEVVDEDERLPSNIPAEADLATSTFSADWGSYLFRLISISTGHGVVFEGRVYSDGTSGPILTTKEGMTKQQAKDLGIPESIRKDFNSALNFLNEEVNLPDSVTSGRTRRSFRELEQLRSQLSG